MSKSQQTWNKKEREKIKQKKKKDKEKKKEERKANPGKSGLDDMIAYVDEHGNITSEPPDPMKKQKIKAEDIEIGIPKKETTDDDDGNRSGTVNFFDESKGFGFINDSGTGERIFFHVSGLIDEIRENDKVSFQTIKGQKGLNAVEVKIIK